MEQEKQQIFRQKSIDRISSPEELNDYLHVTNPAIWVVLAGVILLLVSLFVWSAFTVIESYATGTGVVENGQLTVTFDDVNVAQNVETGMTVTVGELQVPITSVGFSADGERIAGGQAEGIPNGSYAVKVGYKQTQILSMLLN